MLSSAAVDDSERVRRALPHLPIFPLPGAVLLPHALVPLHIFEPRYRKMTRDVDEGGRVLALAHIAGEQTSVAEPPRVLPIIGVGVLARIERLPEGRFNIVLRGVMRARIVEELPSGEPYRLVRAEEIPSSRTTPRAQQLCDSLKRLILALSAARPGAEMQALLQLAARARDPGDVADLVSGALLAAPGERQEVLEAADVSQRLELATQAAAAALARTATRPEALN